MGEPLWPDQGPHLHFELREVEAALRLTDHSAIHFLQPRRWTGSAESAATGEEAWLCFFRDAAHWTRLPPSLTTSDPMRKAMAVLRQFSEVELDRLAYITRRDKELLQQTMTNALARAERAAADADRRAEVERQRAEEERQRAEEEKRRAEEERQRAEEQMRRAEDEKQRAEEQMRRAEDEKQRAEDERKRAEEAEAESARLREKLRRLGVDAYD
ncbi:MAG: hypothetical protein IV100_11855 [Myxococcales bacterium]|nr:hypothetical protein [Myxococcales bacterium]